MNKEFMVKILQAKRLQYEAFKEIMPEPLAKRVIKLESELIEVGKECFTTLVLNAEKSRPDADAGDKSKPRKVTIE